ncbi:MAG TPA: sigma-70 family RNA polymerase sigma factor [Thermoanaerobaculia bacterium]
MDLFAFDDLYVRRLKEHDPGTEAHFNRYFRAILFAKLHKRTPPQDIDDIIQDVFTRVLARLDDVRDGRKFGAFVLGFCNMILLERYRKESRTEPLTEAHEDIAARSDVEEEFFTEEAAAGVRHVLGQVREREGAILRAIFLDEEDRDAICRRFGVSADYLRVCLHRAKEEFRAAYRKREIPFSR